jgi:hypothetical protein
MATQNDLRTLVDDFVARLVAAVEAQAAARVREQVMAAIGVPVRRGPGRPPSSALGVAGLALPRARKAGPKQLCPVPGCKNPAAPVFGMVCAEHKDVPKAKIKEYREARRRAKAKQAGGAQSSRPAAAPARAKAARRARPAAKRSKGARSRPKSRTAPSKIKATKSARPTGASQVAKGKGPAKAPSPAKPAEAPAATSATAQA